MSRVNLPSGGWADFIEPANVTERARRAVRKKSSEIPADVQALFDRAVRVQRQLQGDKLSKAQRSKLEDELEQINADLAGKSTPEVLEVLFELNDLAVCALVGGWSFGAACPLRVEDVQDLGVADYDALQTAAAPFVPQLMGVDFDPNPDPARSTPTTP